jgi:hypothetical protein
LTESKKSSWRKWYLKLVSGKNRSDSHGTVLGLKALMGLCRCQV